MFPSAKIFFARKAPRLFDLVFPKSPNRLLTLEELNDPVRLAEHKARQKQHEDSCTDRNCPFCIDR